MPRGLGRLRGSGGGTGADASLLSAVSGIVHRGVRAGAGASGGAGETVFVEAVLESLKDVLPRRRHARRLSSGLGLLVSPCRMATGAAARARHKSEAKIATENLQTTRTQAPSGGRTQSPWKGLSGMDAARAAKGHGWPFAACPWSGDG